MTCNYILLTTSIIKEDVTKLQRMIDSLREYVGESGPAIRHILLLQNISTERADELRAQMDVPAWTEIITHPGVISLSKARNIMLKAINFAHDADQSTIVAFPDDDCWYPSGTLNHIARIFESGTDFAFCRYGTTAVPKNNVASWQTPGYRDVVFNASSNTLFIKASVVADVGQFNEKLGVGAEYNGGEDLDYAIRAFRIADNVVWSPEILVGHRDKDTSLRGNYFIGSALVLRDNAFCSIAAAAQFFRKLLIGGVLVIKGEMHLDQLTKVFYARLKDTADGT